MANSNPNDTPINTAVLMGIGVIAAAFAFFNLASCTAKTWGTPEYVQAIEKCNESIRIPVTIRPEGTEYTIEIDTSPEVLAMLEKCHETVRQRFSEPSKGMLIPPSIEGAPE